MTAKQIIHHYLTHFNGQNDTWLRDCKNAKDFMAAVEMAGMAIDIDMTNTRTNSECQTTYFANSPIACCEKLSPCYAARILKNCMNLFHLVG